MNSFLKVVGLIFVSCFAINAFAVDRQVNVTGTGEVKAAPDSAAVSLTVQSIRLEAVDAKTDVDTRVNAFLASIEALGFAEEDVTAGTLQTSPRYDYRSGQQTFAGYQASRTLQVEVKDLDMLNDLLEAALGDQIDSINNIQYKVSDSSTMKAKARELAIEDSKQKAMELAQAYEAELGPIVTINYHTQSVTPYYMERPQLAMARMEAADSASTGQYLPDQITFTDQIDVVFDLIVNQ